MTDEQNEAAGAVIYNVKDALIRARGFTELMQLSMTYNSNANPKKSLIDIDRARKHIKRAIATVEQYQVGQHAE